MRILSVYGDNDNECTLLKQLIYNAKNNIPMGAGRPLKEYVQDVISVVNPDYKPEYGKYSYSPIQPMFLQADVSELAKDTGWKPLIKFYN